MSDTNEAASVPSRLDGRTQEEQAVEVERIRQMYTEEQFEKEFVHNVYEEIASHFSSTRYKV